MLRPGVLLVIGIWGKPADCQGVVHFAALSKLLPPPPPGTPGPFTLSADGVLESVVSQAGMTPGVVEEIDVPWVYLDEATLLRGLMAAAPIIRASQLLGEPVVRETILQAVSPFKTETGSYVFKNKARYMIVRV